MKLPIMYFFGNRITLQLLVQISSWQIPSRANMLKINWFVYSASKIFGENI